MKPIEDMWSSNTPKIEKINKTHYHFHLSRRSVFLLLWQSTVAAIVIMSLTMCLMYLASFKLAFLSNISVVDSIKYWIDFMMNLNSQDYATAVSLNALAKLVRNTYIVAGALAFSLFIGNYIYAKKHQKPSYEISEYPIQVLVPWTTTISATAFVISGILACVRLFNSNMSESTLHALHLEELLILLSVFACVLLAMILLSVMLLFTKVVFHQFVKDVDEANEITRLIDED